MQDHQHYQWAADCLATHGYEVILDEPGYIVRRRDNPEEVCKARHLDDLVDLAELFEWAAQRNGRYANPRAAQQASEST